MKKVIALLLTLFFVLGNINEFDITVNANDEEKSMNYYNVVFVTDASGSMKDTDPYNYRNDAISIFMGLLSDGGNNVGNVVFSSGVRTKTNIIGINGKDDKISITENSSKEEPKGWTDIGSALNTAVDMLEKKRDKKLPSIIILLTDGKTEMGTDDETINSKQERDIAVDRAADKGYKIYTICLNDKKAPKGSVDPNEMKRIAKATGGEFQEVSNAEDLRNVSKMFYKMIFTGESGAEQEPVPIPQSGTLIKEFTVSNVGVSEVNIVIFGEPGNKKWKSCSLVKPDKTKIEGSEISHISYETSTTTVIKLKKPEKGDWELRVKGDPGTLVRIDEIINTDLSMSMKVEDLKDNYLVGEEIKFVTELFEGEDKVTDESKYKECFIQLEIQDGDGNLLDTISNSEISESGVVTKFQPDKTGTYYGIIKVDGGKVQLESEKIAINVGNSTPKAKEKVINKHFNLWPFLIKTDGIIDLSGNAIDKEDSKLTYKIQSSSWLEDEYELKDDKLEIKEFNVSKGTFKVDAYDSQGAFCTFEVKVTTTNIGLIAMILIIVGIIIGLIVFGIMTYILTHKKFMGTVNVQNINGVGEGSITKNRGRIKLTAFQVGYTGLNSKSYFQATGKNYIYFISKDKVMADGMYGKTKKIKIESSTDKRIYIDEEQTKGINVTFESYLNNY